MAFQGMENNPPTRIRMRATDPRTTREKFIEEVFVTVEVPFIRVYGEKPNFKAVCTEKDANILLRSDIREKLRKKGLEVQVPLEIKS